MRSYIPALLIMMTLSSAAVAADDVVVNHWNALLKRHIELTNSRLKMSRESLGDVEYYAELAKKRDEALALAEEFAALIENIELFDPLRSMAVELVLTDRYSGAASFLVADEVVRAGLSNQQLKQLCKRLGFGVYRSPASETALRTILSTIMDPQATRLAELSLACVLRETAEHAAAVQQLEARRYRWTHELGEEHVARLMEADIEALLAEAAELLVGVQGQFAGETMIVGERSFDELAARELHFLKNQTIGSSVADIAGEDADGVHFKLSDYADRVRVLLFWGHWCVGCRIAYPDYRSLVSDLPEDDFCFLAVNSDRNLETLREISDDQQVTWRCWWDGGTDPMEIHAQWMLVGAPHVFVLDRSGRIAFVDVRDEELREAVELLVKDGSR